MVFREEVINVELAELLCSKGLRAQPETIVRNGKMPDVIIVVQGVTVILECRFSIRSLRSDAAARIEQGLCDICIALQYDQRLRQCTVTNELRKALSESTYSGEIVFQTSTGIETIPFTKYTIDDLVGVINKSCELIVDSDILKDLVTKVHSSLNELVDYSAANGLLTDDFSLFGELRELLGIQDMPFDKTGSRKDVLSIALFVLLDGMIFHENIHNIDASISSLSFASVPHKDFFLCEWTKIINIDYRPIFDLALDILRHLPNGMLSTEKVLVKLKEIALSVLNSGVLRKHDFMGRIYHKLLLRTSGKYYATYYTALPSAYMLANLTIRSQHHSWKHDNLSDLGDFRIIDPACGSGTLLSAAYNSLRNMYLSRLSYEEFQQFHRVMIEQTLYGWDVLRYAAHLTFTILNLHYANLLIRNSNIRTLSNGVDSSGNAMLGSLSLLSKGVVPMDKSEGLGFATEDKGKEHCNSFAGAFDVVIMNPPFSRDAKPNTVFGYSDATVKKKMKEELSNIIKRCNKTGIGRAGLGAVFILLADHLLKPNGRLALVAPRSMLTGVSWKRIRDLLFTEYEIKYIISNHDVGTDDIEGWNWSESTNLGEVMIVAEKTRRSISQRQTIYITLWNKPENKIAAEYATIQVQNNKLDESLTEGIFDFIYFKDRPIGAFYKVKQEVLERSWLAPCLFASPELNGLVLSIPEMVPTVNLISLLESNGMDISQVKRYFERSPVESKYKLVLGQQSTMNSLALGVKHVQSGRAKRPQAEKKFYEQSAQFLLSSRPHLSNDAVVAVLAPKTVLATAFWECRFRHPQVEPLMLLWFNSTLGLLLYLSSSTSSRGDIFKTKKGQMRRMKVLDPSALAPSVFDEARYLYEKVKRYELPKFAEQFAMAYEGKGVRKEIDDFFLEHLQFKQCLRRFYRLLSREPIFNNERLLFPKISKEQGHR